MMEEMERMSRKIKHLHEIATSLENDMRLLMLNNDIKVKENADKSQDKPSEV